MRLGNDGNRCCRRDDATASEGVFGPSVETAERIQSAVQSDQAAQIAGRLWLLAGFKQFRDTVDQ